MNKKERVAAVDALLVIATQLRKRLLVSISTIPSMAEEQTNIVDVLERAASTDAGISIYAPGNAASACHRTIYQEFLNKTRINAQTIRRIKCISKEFHCAIAL